MTLKLNKKAIKIAGLTAGALLFGGIPGFCMAVLAVGETINVSNPEASK